MAGWPGALYEARARPAARARLRITALAAAHASSDADRRVPLLPFRPRTHSQRTRWDVLRASADGCRSRVVAHGSGRSAAPPRCTILSRVGSGTPSVTVLMPRRISNGSG